MVIRERCPRAALVGIVLAVALMLALLAADPAWAKTSQVGINVGEEAQSWAKALVFPFAALGGLGAYFKRDLGMAFSLLAITMIVGAFAYNPGDVVEKVIGSLWSSLLS